MEKENMVFQHRPGTGKEKKGFFSAKKKGPDRNPARF